MSDDRSGAAPKHARLDRTVEVRLRDVAGEHAFISTSTHTINVSEHGLLMEVPRTADVAIGQEVLVSLQWANGTFETTGEIVRFESPYWKDGWSSVMALRLEHALPGQLLNPTGPGQARD